MKIGKKTKLEALQAARSLGVAQSQGLSGIGTIEVICRLAKEHCTIQEANCNGTTSKRQEVREQNIETQISELAASVGLKAEFSGDPRGFTVKLHGNGAYNTWGGLESGYGVGERR